MKSCSQDELLREEEVQTRALLSQDEGQAVETRTFQRLTSVGAFATLGFLALAAGHQVLGGAPSTGAQQRDGVVRLAEAPATTEALATSPGHLVAAAPVATVRPLAPVAPVTQVALGMPPTFGTAEASEPSGEDTVDSEGESGGKGGQTASTGKSKEASKKQDEESEKPLKFTDSRHTGCDKQPKPSDDEEDAVPAASSDGTVKLWGQCGGSGYDGDTECITGLACISKSIKGMKDYKQCKPDPDFNCQSAEGNKDMKCYYKVTWDMETGINTMPGMYHGLSPQSSFAEYQEQNFNFLSKKSGCPAPCAPGTCYEVLAKEGCDSHNEWACEKDDHSLAFDCCCRKYHPNITKKWDVIKEEKRSNEKPSLFCIAMIMPRSYEVGLMRGQFERGIGIFDSTCAEWAVFSNESISLNCESADKKYNTVVLNGTLEVKRGGEANSALNTVVFQRFWDRVLEDGRVWKHDWVVKVDPDTLFLPSRLREMINSGEGAFGKKEPGGGMYINNCFLGMHGPIEVFNKAALGNYFNGKAKCSKGEPGKRGQEDVFLRECFKLLGVEKVDAFNILLEGENACKEMPSTEEPHARPPCFAPEAAFHPFKNIPSMMRCWAEAVSHHVAGQMAPATVQPSDENGRHESR